MAVDQRLRRQLLSMRGEEEAMHRKLLAAGERYGGYPSRLEQIHKRNAERLKRILERHGWPCASLVGADASEAAWQMLKHAIANPELMRKALPLLEAAAARLEASPAHAAMLEDRIRALEGRPQRYGSHLDWDEQGQLSVYPPLEDPESVEERRQAAGLPPLEEYIEEQREHAAACGEAPPEHLERYREQSEAWARHAGWRR